MIYKTYEEYKNRYYMTQQNYNDLLTEKERLFVRTQPNAIRYDKLNVKSSPNSNVLEDYVIEKEKKQLDRRIAEMKVLLDDRRNLMLLKEAELRKSKDMYDRIYTMRYLEDMSVERIAKKVNYSVSQVYRILTKIIASL